MKLEQSHIDHIRIAFQQMQSKEDLLHVLNEVKPLIYGDKAVPFELKQLTWYANPKLGKKRYTEFKIKKKSGAERSIHAPIKGLKSLQKTLSFVLQCVYEPHNAAMGFVRDRSIVDNAKLHVGSKYVYNIDLKDFFPSVDQARVWKCLQLKPFNLDKASSVEPQYEKWDDFKKEHLKTHESVTFLKGKGRMFTNTPYGTLYLASNFDLEKDKYVLLGGSSLKTKGVNSLEGTLWLVNKIPDTSRLDIANIIASICCTEMEVERKNEAGEWEKVKRNVLPQGAPTSPVITNIICQKLDKRLAGVAKRFGLKYSRYADDITFSSQHTIYQADSEFIDEIRRIITQQGFHIKESKTRLQKDGYRKEVTGLLVNEKVNVQQRYIKQLRMWLYYWETYGYERASGYFLRQYITDKGHVKNGKPDMVNVIGGKLDYLKMVKGADNELYVKLKGRFDVLTGRSKPQTEAKIECIVESKWNDNDNSAKEILAVLEAETEKGDYDVIIKGLKKLHRFNREGIKFDGTNDKEFIEIRSALFMIMSYPTFYDYVDKILNKMDEDLALPDANEEEIIARYDKILEDLKEGIIPEFLQEKKEPIGNSKLELFKWNNSTTLNGISKSADLRNPFDENDEVSQQNTNKLRIKINTVDSEEGLIKLKRQIIIKKGESLPHEELLENNEVEEKEIDLSKHKPLDVSKFLKYFQNGKLKWLTHKYDEGSYNRSVLIQEAKDEFMSLTRSFIIQPALYERVNWFGFVSNQEKFYFLNKFHYTNWQSPNVLKWEVENPNMHPINSDLLFIEMFGPFKKSIELKDKELKNLISNQLVSSLGGLYTSFDFEYKDLDNVNFYTDVDALKRGLSYLFNAIKQRSENGRKVKFNYRRVSDIEGRKRILEIIHINSSCNKSLEKNELFKGDLLAAEKALFGICDWSIISKSPDYSFNKLNVLFDINSNKMPKEKIEESLIEGFTHILTFYA